MGVGNLPRVVAWRCAGRESNPRPLDRESDTLTTTPPSHPLTALLSLTHRQQYTHAFCHTLCWSFLQQCCMLVYHMHCDIQTFVPDRCLVVQLNNVLKVFTFPTFNQPIVVLQHKTPQCYYFTELQWISPNTINFCTEKPSLFFTLTLKLLMFNIFLPQKFQKAAHSKSGKKMVKQQVLMYQEL